MRTKKKRPVTRRKARPRAGLADEVLAQIEKQIGIQPRSS